MADFIRDKNNPNGLWHIEGARSGARCGSIKKTTEWEHKKATELTERDTQLLCQNCLLIPSDWSESKSKARREYRQDQHFISDVTRLSRRRDLGGEDGTRNWRGRRISSEQETFLVNHGYKAGEVSGWTRGRASDEIDKIKEKDQGEGI